MTFQLLKKYQNLDPVIRQLKFWRKYKTKPVKTYIKFLVKKTSFYIFEKVLVQR